MNHPVPLGEKSREIADPPRLNGVVCQILRPSGSPSLTILDLMTDPELLGETFKASTWNQWRVVLAAAFGLPLRDDQIPAYRTLTGRTNAPATPARELWAVIGRRGGKSMIAALVAVYLTCFRRYRLSPGETGTFKIVAPDRRQCRVIKGYVSGLLQSSALLQPMIASETKDSIELTNGLVIEVQTASFKTARGYTVVGCVIDEAAFLPCDAAAEPDKEILAALRPAMATVAGAMLMVISSPYARRGELFRMHATHFGKNDDPILIVAADSKTMNASIPDHVIAAAYEQDEAAARAEFGGQFRSDVGGIFSLDAVRACVVPGRRELPPIQGVTYRAFADPSGGSSDAFTLAIAHSENGVGVLDAVRERRPPFSPDAVVAEFAELLKSYGIRRVVSDRYAGSWATERWAAHDVHNEPSAKPKSDLYLHLQPLVNSQRIELLDLPNLIGQIAGLERRTGRGGRDSVDHAPGSHDDLANVCAGVLAVGQAGTGPRIRPVFDDDDDSDFDDARPGAWALQAP